MPSTSDNQNFALKASQSAAAVANFCDHIEHNEPAETAWILDAGEQLAMLAINYSETAECDVIQLYAARLAAIEARNVLAELGSFDGSAAALAATTWRELQLVQAAHDRAYHPDVVGMSRLEQLRHYAFHLAKIVGAFATAGEDELINRRLPDVLLFAIKLRTVMGTRLPDNPLPRHAATA